MKELDMEVTKESIGIMVVAMKGCMQSGLPLVIVGVKPVVVYIC